MANDAGCGIPVLALIALSGLLLAGCASGPERESYRRPGGVYTVGRPYEVNGVWYYPVVNYHYDKTGIASWYGAEFDGKYTANGEIYDMNRLTAAHTILPLPSIVEVTNLENGRSLRLRVNDRGPYVDRRLIDVSRRAAQLLGFETRGTAPVRVRILKEESIAAAAAMPNGAMVVAEPADSDTAQPAAPASPLPAPLAPQVARARPTIVAAPTSAREMPTSAPIIAAENPRPSGRIYVQAGAFAVRDNAQRVRERIAGLGSVAVTTVSVDGIEVYRVRLGPVDSTAEADRLLARVVNSGYPEARIVGDQNVPARLSR
jgi:rare lipoprotein A